jgi:3-oxoacyl-[acyl-carrier protein] reductase
MPYSRDSRVPRLLSFEGIQAGDTAELYHQLTEADLETFAALTGDYNPLHVDASFARRTSLRNPVVHGMLSASFISTLIGMILPGQGALWTSLAIDFIAPAHLNDTLHVFARVKQKSPATRALVLEIQIENQRNQALVTGTATVKTLELEKEENVVERHVAKVALVTGGGRGIGAATARLLSQQGYTVAINYLRSSENAARLVSEIRDHEGIAAAFQADVADPGQVKAMITAVEKQFGPVEAVVCCAAEPSNLRPFDDLDWNAFQKQLEVQVRGAYNCVKAVLPRMIEAQRGSIVFVGSIAIDGSPPPNQADYIVAKSALTALARCLAVEYGPKGIRINVVAPGMTQTDLIAQMPEKAKMLARMQAPLRRLADPQDIAETIAFLLSPKAAHITGETIRVCGGAVMI